ncbi:phosphoribosylamine--glycine ligase [Desulfovibrionales bacterium]
MNILLVGSGGREHALAWKIHLNPNNTLYIAPGNGGTATLGQNIAIADTDIAGLVAFALDKNIDLVVAGPELPLTLGLTDTLANHGIACFGPCAYAAQLEGSKLFAKEMMQRTGVPTAAFQAFDAYEPALAYARAHPLPMVIKADGLAAGKGVVIAQTYQEAEQALHDMMVKKIFGQAGEQIIIEEALQGEEASFLVFCDGTTVVPMPSLQDHKRIGDNDTGPNTGGMGAYSPAPLLPDDKTQTMTDMVIRPIVQEMAAQGHPFKGVLYAGLMFTPQGPMVLEYNVRFGDPECQPLMARLDSDLVEIMLACVQGTLRPELVRFSSRPSCCVVIAAKGYPQAYPKGMEISGLEAAARCPDVTVFHAGTTVVGKKIRTSGGRVLGVTALGNSLAQARDAAYVGVQSISFENAYYRTDIANKGLGR